jgi:hypothetical protein
MRYILIILLSSPLCLFSQVVIKKDPRVDMLLKKQEEVNKKAYLESNRAFQGFRVQVINTNNRQKALEIKTHLLREFGDHKTYLLYQSPYFRLHIGNFRTREEAEGLRNQLRRLYPTGVIIVPANVELKPEEEEEEAL